MMKSILLIAIAMVGTACQSLVPSGAGDAFRGFYVFEFERQEFISCEGESYWVANPNALDRVADDSAKDGVPLLVRAVEEHGAVGRVNGYSKQLTILSAELDKSGKYCQTAPARRG